MLIGHLSWSKDWDQVKNQFTSFTSSLLFALCLALEKQTKGDSEIYLCLGPVSALQTISNCQVPMMSANKLSDVVGKNPGRYPYFRTLTHEYLTFGIALDPQRRFVHVPLDKLSGPDLEILFPMPKSLSLAGWNEGLDILRTELFGRNRTAVGITFKDCALAQKFAHMFKPQDASVAPFIGFVSFLALQSRDLQCSKDFRNWVKRFYTGKLSLAAGKPNH